MSSPRAAKRHAIARMQRHPRPHPSGGWFCPIRRLHGRAWLNAVGPPEIGHYENFRFITSPALDVLRE